jgi:hypothetical protein
VTAEREMWATSDGAILYNVHPAAECGGAPCWIHNPSDHHMRDWPMIRRKNGVVERTCLHGYSHPDPDSLWYLIHVMHYVTPGEHHCEGCCAPPKERETT